MENDGTAFANSGDNEAIGNSSDNESELNQEAELNDGDDLEADGPQTASNGGGATNASKGTGKVGTGNAVARGNVSTTNFAQEAVVDGNAAFANLEGEVTNEGLGIANTGDNEATGNDSENSAILNQEADGIGTAANNGSASNTSDGAGLVGDPDCEDKAPPVVTPPGVVTPPVPGAAALPKTGGPLEAQAAFALMLLLVGFGLRRKSAQLS